MILERLVARGRVVAPASGDYSSILRTLANRQVSGGQAYDALIVATARSAGADVLLTFNLRHFERLAGDGILVRQPGMR